MRLFLCALDLVAGLEALSEEGGTCTHPMLPEVGSMLQTKSLRTDPILAKEPARFEGELAVVQNLARQSLNGIDAEALEAMTQMRDEFLDNAQASIKAMHDTENELLIKHSTTVQNCLSNYSKEAAHCALPDWQASHADVINKYSDRCNDASAAIQAAKAECVKESEALQKQYREWRIGCYTACSNQRICHEVGKEDLDDAFRAALQNAQSRMHVYTVVTRMGCYVDVILLPKTTSHEERKMRLTECEVLDIDTSHLNIDHPFPDGVPDRHRCKLPVNPRAPLPEADSDLLPAKFSPLSPDLDPETLQFRNVCVSAKGDQHGTINLEAGTCVNEIVIHYVDGHVGCRGSRSASNFGCFKNKVGLVWTDKDETTVIMPKTGQVKDVRRKKNKHWYEMLDSHGQPRKMRDVQTLHMRLVEPLKVRGPLDLWYNEDLTGHTEADNEGTACYDIDVHRALSC